MIIENCIPTLTEWMFGIVSSLIILAVLQAFFGNYFVSLLIPIHKIPAAIPLILGAIIFFMANEFWSRLIIQNRWENQDFTPARLIPFIKSKIGTSIISSFTLWISMVLGIIIFQQIVFSNFIWRIVFLMLPLLIFINFINAIWYPYSRRIPPIALAFVIPVVSALIAMSPFVNVWV
jgi:hypothetical protein